MYITPFPMTSILYKHVHKPQGTRRDLLTPILLRVFNWVMNKTEKIFLAKAVNSAISKRASYREKYIRNPPYTLINICKSPCCKQDKKRNDVWVAETNFL